MRNALLGSIAVMALALPAFASAPDSGLNVGEMVSAFHPTHVGGPDKGTDTCPPCKYGNRPAVQVWHNHDADENLVAVINHLDGKVAASKKELKAFAIRVAFCDGCAGENTKLAEMVKAPNVGIAHINASDEAIEAYKYNIDREVKNTIFVYKNRKVVAKFVNFTADKASFAKLDAAIAQVEK